MSTILETLKKLEEDKRLLEKDLDLKDLVLQDDPKQRAIQQVSWNKSILMGLGLAVVIVFAMIASGRSSSENDVVQVSQAPTVQKKAPAKRKSSGQTIGIPLSNIPERHLRFEEKVTQTLPPVTKEPVLKNSQPVEVPEPLEINEIRDLIQTATSKANQPEPYSETLISRGVSIPNLKVKGIIFFSSGSPSNHIFVSTPESKNRKIRLGESVQSATLTNIEPNRVVFSYRGELVQLRIGE